MRARGLPARSAMHPHQRRRLAARRCLVRLPQDVRDGHAVEALEPHHARIDQVRRVDRRIQRTRQLLRLATEVDHVQVAGLAVAIDVERHPVFRARDAHVAHVAGGQAGQGDRLAAGGLDHFELRAAIGVDHRHPVAAVVREIAVGDVPFGRLHRLVPPVRQVHAAQLGELACIVGDVIEPLAIRAEVGRGELRLTGVLGDLGHLAGGEVGHEQVGVVGGVDLVQRQPAAIGGDLAGLVAGGVLEDPGARVGLAVIAVQVEVARVAFVAGHEERLAVAAEAGELGAQLGTWGQVPLVAVRADDIQVVEFVAALVAGDQHPVIVGEIGDGVMVVGGRGGDRGPVAATDRHRVRVPHAGLVRRKQQLRLVGGERGAGHADGIDELLDPVRPAW